MTQESINPGAWLKQQQEAGREIVLIVDGLNGRDVRRQLLAVQPMPTFINLYEGTDFRALADEAPYLIRYGSSIEPVVRRLLNEPEPLWGWFSSVPTELDLKLLARHWQDRLAVTIDGQRGLYRFSDNRVFSNALTRLPPEALPAYLGPIMAACCFDMDKWIQAENPQPAQHAVPESPRWLTLFRSTEEQDEILFNNVRRYLLSDHYDAFIALSEREPPYPWLKRILQLSREWQWDALEQRQFLVLHALYAADDSFISAWAPIPGETSAEHYRRINLAYEPIGSLQ